MSAYYATTLECGKCSTSLSLKVTEPSASHGRYSSFVHNDRVEKLEPEFCRDDDGSAFAGDQAEPTCPLCGGPLERSVHSTHWVCRDYGADHYSLTEDGVETTHCRRGHASGVPS